MYSVRAVTSDGGGHLRLAAMCSGRDTSSRHRVCPTVNSGRKLVPSAEAGWLGARGCRPPRRDKARCSAALTEAPGGVRSTVWARLCRVT
ncbi:hypothetical protein MRX96_007508 [Rhipicephalus microplus]